ncbi:MAG: DNA-binding protein [uncultured bacterium]|nr:MAG: DNA-binding protein [uncultured bacterium]
MNDQLNISVISEFLQKAGLNASKLSQQLSVSRETVSKWLNGESFPRPEKLLQIATLLSIPFNELIIRQNTINAPVIAFRKRASTKTTLAHVERAKDMGFLLNNLVPFLNFENMLINPPTLKNPKIEYNYIQEVVNKVRTEIGVSISDKIDFQHLIRIFNNLQAVLIPVLWGQKKQHENALHIYLPDSKTTWIYLNLDSEIHDFKFWMAHELGHVHTNKSFINDEAEDFADDFAGALLFPKNLAETTYKNLIVKHSNLQKIAEINQIAEKLIISPVSIYKEVNKYAVNYNLPEINLENEIYRKTTTYNKTYKKISETLFGENIIEPKKYISVSKELFCSNFFDALKGYLNSNNKTANFIQSILNIPILDAKGIFSELM